VAQAVLMSAVTPSLKKSAENPEGIDESVFGALLKALEDDRAGFLADFREGFFNGASSGSAVSRGVLDWYSFLASQASLRATVECARAWADTDFRGDINVPPEITAHLAARLIVNARYIEYEGSGHAIGITDRERVNADVLAFLREAGR
jgi:pimeloyl-ACP methyl ester carboxylesterase